MKWTSKKITHRLRRADGSLIASVVFVEAKDGCHDAYVQLRFGERQTAVESCARALTRGGQKSQSALNFMFAEKFDPDITVEKVA